jgi:hypothetical protein
LDNNYQTWNAFQNNSWPADYLIDQSGNIRYVSLGEGDYDKTEQAIQVLLGINEPLKTSRYSVPITSNQTPETYFGTNRAMNYVGSPTLTDGVFNFQPNSNLSSNNWTLGGSWSISPEYITSNGSNATLHFKATAKNIYVVASTANNQPASVIVGLPASQAGQYGSREGYKK